MLILASSSPRRSQLLQLAGLDFTVEAADIDERTQPGETPATYVQRLALEKAQAIWDLRRQDISEDLIVLGADTTVVCDGTILGKPANVADARRMLEMLAGRTHQVLTGIAAVSIRGLFSNVEITQVFFDLIDEEEMVHYLASGEAMDKAGAYGIQGYAARWIPRIEGCFFNVMGLPISRTLELLAKAREGRSEARPPESRLAAL
ncbi:Maf family protein [Edaphobacter modestus]|uniref:dTTP/UTP pyrophosphatase n=1 Tax=Edaphobacter modestus TaxID=388466 RepID=A0A4Q7YVW6_9BACT|nr:Maf family protein [Edaphobacter modestus]RZU41820.1 septum formation protein [Edaphobacter modestus]